jgi:hypothetical protein
MAPPDERGPDLLAHPARVGGNKDFHWAANLPGRRRRLREPGTDEQERGPMGVADFPCAAVEIEHRLVPCGEHVYVVLC